MRRRTGLIVGDDRILAADRDEAIGIAKGIPEFEFGTTPRVEVRPITVKEEKWGLAHPKGPE